MIKWFDSRTMPNIPRLQDQGDLVKMLTTLLSEDVEITSVSDIASVDNVTYLITVPAEHNIVMNSVIAIDGSTQNVLKNSEFKVISVNDTAITIECAELIEFEDNLIVKYPGLKWSAHYAETYKSCFKPTNPKFNAYLRIDDTPYSNYEPGYIEASVEICSVMGDINTAQWQAPYDYLEPDRNRNRTTPEENWFVWCYGYGSTASPIGDVRHYFLVGDDAGFWLFLHPYADTNFDCSVVGMPILSGVNNEEIQCLVARNNKHGPSAREGLLNADEDNETIAMHNYDQLGKRCIITDNSNDVVVPTDTVTLQPIYAMFDKTVLGNFKNLHMSFIHNALVYRNLHTNNNLCRLIRTVTANTEVAVITMSDPYE